MRFILLLALSLSGCQTMHEESAELLCWSKNGEHKVTYIYYERGHYVAYYFVDGKLITKERLDK